MSEIITLGPSLELCVCNNWEEKCQIQTDFYGSHSARDQSCVARLLRQNHTFTCQGSNHGRRKISAGNHEIINGFLVEISHACGSQWTHAALTSTLNTVFCLCVWKHSHTKPSLGLCLLNIHFNLLL